jgi:predicted dehydrogenase
MKAFRTAIAGLGKIGFECDVNTAKKYVLSYARAFSLQKGFALAAGFAIDRSKLDAFEEKYRVPGYHYKDLKKNLSDIDAVVISSPSENHFEVFKKVVSS